MAGKDDPDGEKPRKPIEIMDSTICSVMFCPHAGHIRELLANPDQARWYKPMATLRDLLLAGF